jgi:Yip1 domain
MNLVDRVKGILLSPKEEWPKISAETETTQSLYTGYIMILSAIGPVALLLHSFALGITGAIAAYLVALVVTYVMALIVDVLAPYFGGEKNFIQSLKLTAYSYTAVWVAGILHLIGVLGGLLSLLAALYTLYTFYLGVTVMKKCPQEKAVLYTVVVVLCGIVLAAVMGSLVMSTIFGGMPMTTGAMRFYQ